MDFNFFQDQTMDDLTFKETEREMIVEISFRNKKGGIISNANITKMPVTRKSIEAQNKSLQEADKWAEREKIREEAMGKATEKFMAQENDRLTRIAKMEKNMLQKDSGA